MGIEAQAFLVYGVSLGSELPSKFKLEDADYLDLEDVLAAHTGLVNPGYASPEYPAYNAKKAALYAACPVDLIVYGTDENPLYLLCVKGSTISADDEGPSRVKVEQLTVSEDKVKAFQDFCKEYGVNRGSLAWLLIARRC